MNDVHAGGREYDGGGRLTWRRLHPLTPVLRSGRMLAVALLAVSPQALQNGTAAYLFGGVLVALPLFAAIAYVSWRRMRYAVDGGDLRIESGVLLHRSRRVPLARIQAIDVVRPLIGRALGLAELRLEVVGGGRSEAPLAYLREPEAAALRLELLSLARGESQPPRKAFPECDGVPAPVPAPTATPLVTVPTSALIGAMLLDARVMVPILLMVLTLVSAFVLPDAATGGLFASTFGTGLAVVEITRRRLLAEWGFTVLESPDGLVLQHGLTETRSQTVPEGRVQGVRIVVPLLWRLRGWSRVEIDVAGYAGGRQALQTSTLLPVAPQALARALVSRVLGAEPAIELAKPPRRARWLSPFAYNVLGVGADDRFIVTRNGWLRHDTAVVPLAKVQGFRWEQGPIQRRLRLATLHLATAGQDVHAVALHRDATEARALLETLTQRARVRRRTTSLRG